VEFGAGTYTLGYLAGVVSTLSPCVLPLLPLLLATAMGEHRYGAIALATGLAVSFAVVGSILGSIGFSLGIEPERLRQISAVFMIAFAVVLLSARLKEYLARLASGLGALGANRVARLRASGWTGQFVLGLLLGVVWTPCTGPTLGAAVTLASQGRQLGEVAVLMMLFGLGAATPLAVIGSLSAGLRRRSRGRLAALAKGSSVMLGGLLLIFGAGILSGIDRRVESLLVDVTPQWLTEFTTRF